MKSTWQNVKFYIFAKQHIEKSRYKIVSGAKIMKTIYPAKFHREGKGYWVEFQDLEGCYSDGLTLEEAMKNSEEALSAHLAYLLDKDLPIPEPSDILLLPSLGKDEFTTYICANPEKYITRNKAVKKTLTLPQWLNDAAEHRHLNFSSVLKDALIERV